MLFRRDKKSYIATLFGICSGISISFSLNRKYNFRKTDVPQERHQVYFYRNSWRGAVIDSYHGFGRQDMDARFAKIVYMGLVLSRSLLQMQAGPSGGCGAVR
jgi:hypothetical protein